MTGGAAGGGHLVLQVSGDRSGSWGGSSEAFGNRNAAHGLRLVCLFFVLFLNEGSISDISGY